MGYDVFLIPKTRNDEIKFGIFECKQANKIKSLSRDFAMFQSRNFEGCEFYQVEKIFKIDLSIYTSYPKNYEPHLDELQYQLWKAEEDKNSNEVAKINKKIEDKRLYWEKNYEKNNEGWVDINKFRQVTLNLLAQIKRKPNFGNEIKVAKGWEYNWQFYFFAGKKNNIEQDLKSILATLDCFEKYQIKYVAIIGG